MPLREALTAPVAQASFRANILRVLSGMFGGRSFLDALTEV